MKNVDLDERISFLDHVFGCTQCECKPNKIITDEYRKMFESRISAGATENLPGWEKPHAKTAATWKDMLKSALIRVAIWQTKRQSSCTQFLLLAWTTITPRKRNLGQLENCQKYAHKMLNILGTNWKA